MVIGGVEHRAFTPREAITAGTAVIYQSFSLVSTLTVAENVFLGDEILDGPRIDMPRGRGGRRLSAPATDLANQPVGRLSAGDSMSLLRRHRTSKLPR
jgi:ABC-type sugar transport system ATPase subunit